MNNNKKMIKLFDELEKNNNKAFSLLKKHLDENYIEKEKVLRIILSCSTHDKKFDLISMRELIRKIKSVK